MKPASLLYEQVLPLVTNMLVLHTTIKLLKIKCSYMDDVNSSPPIQHFFQATFLHPSLEYVKTSYAPLLMGTYKAQEKSLIDQHKKLYPLKSLPIIKF